MFAKRILIRAPDAHPRQDRPPDRPECVLAASGWNASKPPNERRRNGEVIGEETILRPKKELNSTCRKTLFYKCFMHWARRDSNPHDLYGQGILSPQRLPFRHSPGRCPYRKCNPAPWPLADLSRTRCPATSDASMITQRRSGYKGLTREHRSLESDSGRAGVSVVQSPDLRDRDHFPVVRRLDFTTNGRVSAKR